MDRRRRRGCSAPQPQCAANEGPRRRHDRSLSERRTSHAWKRLSDAVALAWLGRQHEHQVGAPDPGHRPTWDDILRSQDLRSHSAEWKGVSILFHPGSEIVYHASLSWPGIERSGLL